MLAVHTHGHGPAWHQRGGHLADGDCPHVHAHARTHAHVRACVDMPWLWRRHCGHGFGGGIAGIVSCAMRSGAELSGAELSGAEPCARARARVRVRASGACHRPAVPPSTTCCAAVGGRASGHGAYRLVDCGTKSKAQGCTKVCECGRCGWSTTGGPKHQVRSWWSPTRPPCRAHTHPPAHIRHRWARQVGSRLGHHLWRQCTILKQHHPR